MNKNEDYKELADNLTDEVVDLRIENEKLKKINKQLTKQLSIYGVVNWLPFKEENYIKFIEISNKNKLLKKYADGTVLKDGDEYYNSIMTHFAELH